MILTLMFVLVASQTIPTVAQDEYGSGISEGSSTYNSMDSTLYDFLRQSEECTRRYANITLKAPHGGNGK